MNTIQIVASVCLVLGWLTHFFVLRKRNGKKKPPKNKTVYKTFGTVVGRKLVSDGFMDEVYVNVKMQDGTTKKLLSQSFYPREKGGIKPETLVECELREWKKDFLGSKPYELVITDERYVWKLTDSVWFYLSPLVFFLISIILNIINIVQILSGA